MNGDSYNISGSISPLVANCFIMKSMNAICVGESGLFGKNDENNCLATFTFNPNIERMKTPRGFSPIAFLNSSCVFKPV